MEMNAVSGRSEGRVVDHCGVALDDAALLEAAHPLVDRGGGHAHGLAEVGVAHPAVLREEVDDAAVLVFHDSHPTEPAAARVGPCRSRRPRPRRRGPGLRC